MSEQQGNTYLTPYEAWDDFYQVVYPEIKAGLKWQEKNRIITANRDRHGLRKRAGGTWIRLDVKRIRDILEKYAPGRYGIEQVTRFWIVPQESVGPG